MRCGFRISTMNKLNINFTERLSIPICKFCSNLYSMLFDELYSVILIFINLGAILAVVILREGQIRILLLLNTIESCLQIFEDFWNGKTWLLILLMRLHSIKKYEFDLFNAYIYWLLVLLIKLASKARKLNNKMNCRRRSEIVVLFVRENRLRKTISATVNTTYD